MTGNSILYAAIGVLLLTCGLLGGVLPGREPHNRAAADPSEE